jgi:protein SCO1/2
MARIRFPFLVIVTLTVAGCARSGVREYPLRGQIVAVNPTRQELTIKHEDIPNFMPGMTMPFKVRDGKLLEGRVPGDLVEAVLVVEESDAYLRRVQRTGSAPLTEPPPDEARTMLQPGESIADAAFTDENGAAVRISELRGKVVAVTFIYTRCPLPNFCPLMDRHFRTVQGHIATDENLNGQVQLRSISFDPDFDRPPVLATYARANGANPAIWRFLTGERAEIERFAGQFGVSIVREDPTGKEIVHNLRTAVIDRTGHVVTMLGGNEWKPEELLAAIRGAVAKR